MKPLSIIACVLALLPIAATAGTVNIKDFGAVPNDGQSDTTAFRQAMVAAGDGGTILCDGGTFNLDGLPADGLELLPNRIYRGQNGGVIKGRGSNGQIVSVRGDNVSFLKLGFNGGGIFMDKTGGGFNTNIVFDGCVFKMDSTGENPNGITFKSGLQSSVIKNCYFTGYTSSFSIYGYNYQGLTIANNEFVNARAGMHIDAFVNSGNLLNEQNFMTGLKGMGMEFQSTATNLVFQDNWYENPNLTSVYDDNKNSMAFSLILDKSSNITIRRNVVIAPQRPDGVGCRIGFEVGGDNTLVEDCYINGINHSLAMNDGVGTASVTVRNNRFMNFKEGVNNTFPRATAVFTVTNTGPAVTLSREMEQRIADQQKPGIGNKRYGSSTQGIPTPTPAPTTKPATQPTGDYVAAVVDLNRSTSAWGPIEVNQSNGEAARNDGQPITINGYAFPLGYGIHAPASIIFVAPARAKAFVAAIGIDDETNGKGQVAASVLVNGETKDGLLLKSGNIWLVKVDVKPADEVKISLAVEGSPDFAHASIGYPRFELGDVTDDAAKDALILSLQAELTRETERANALQRALDINTAERVVIENALERMKAAVPR